MIQCLNLLEEKISGLEKATALLLSLGVEASSRVLQYLGESEIERVLLAISEAGSISNEVRKDGA